MLKKKSEVGRFFKHSSIYLFGNILNRLGAFLLLPVYTNYLTTTEYGVLELFYAILAVVTTFLSAGLAHATLRFYFDFDNEREQNEVVTTTLIASFLLTSIGTMVISFWNISISTLVFSSDLYANSINLILATIVFELSSQICLAYIRAIEKSKLFVYVALFKLIVQFSLNVYFVVFAGEGVFGILKGNLITVIIGWLVLVIYTVKSCGLQFNFLKLGTILKYSLPFVLGSFTGMVSNNVDKFTLNHFESMAAVGIYMLAYKFGLLLEQFVGEPFNRSYGSFRFSIMKRDDAASIQSDIVRYLVCGTVFVGLGICLYIHDLLMIMSAPEYLPAAMVLPVIILAAIIQVVSYPAQTGILVAKKTKYFFYFGLVVAIIAVIVNFFFVQLWGTYGAAFALCITNLCSLLLMHYKSQTYFKVEYELSKILLMILLGAALYLLSWLTLSLPFVVALIIKSLLAMSYLIIIFKTPFFLKDSEKKYVGDFLMTKVLRTN